MTDRNPDKYRSGKTESNFETVDRTRSGAE